MKMFQPFLTKQIRESLELNERKEPVLSSKIVHCVLDGETMNTEWDHHKTT